MAPTASAEVNPDKLEEYRRELTAARARLVDELTRQAFASASRSLILRG